MEIIIIKEIEKYISPKGQPKRQFLCKCFCGKEFNVTLSNLKSNNTKSCGCIRQKKSNKIISLYKTWKDIKQRCYNSNNKDFKNYGQRGIKLYDLWVYDYNTFQNWILNNIGDRPLGLTLDRINNDGNYEPGNLKWSTKSEQNKNRRKFGFLK
jgi:hypothetical protein